MAFNPNDGPVVVDRDEDGNILFSNQSTGARLMTIHSDRIEFHVTQTDDTTTTTSTTTTAGA